MPKKKTAPHAEKNNEQLQKAATVYRLLEMVDDDSHSPFREWLNDLRDRAARVRILSRLTRIEQGGNFGNHRERISGAVSELRVDYGPGYRDYYVRRGDILIILLGGGVKAGQQADITAAVTLWEKNKDDAEGLSREFRGGSA